MSIPMKELVVRDEPDAQLTTPNLDGVAMFERMARDPNVAVDKIERLMDLWERGQARKAQGAFFAAMTDAQCAMRPVARDANNPQTHSKYASYRALDDALRPIYSQHGFALTFNTDTAPQPEHIRILCKVMHRDGHSEAYHIDMPADGKGAKGGDVMTKTHATGSAVSYGMRYLLKMVFNVATGEGDDDGNRAAKPDAAAPKGFDDWASDMLAAAEDSLEKARDAWKKSRPEFRDFATKHRPQLMDALRRGPQKGGNHAA